MRNRSKGLLLLLCLVLLVTAAITVTLAFLTDRESVKNSFTVGNVQIDLDESVVDPDGDPVVDENGDPVREEEGNEYHLVPGKTYLKDPMVTVKAGSERCYVRMMVTLNCMDEIREIFGDGFLPENYVQGWDPQKWVCVGVSENGNNTATYEFRYYTTVDASDSTDNIPLEPLFTHFSVPAELTGDQLLTIADFEILVVGHAIQMESFDSEDAAWTAFDFQYKDN